MKRVPGAVLLGLGVFFLLTAVLLRVWAAPALVKVPLKQDVVSVSEATDASYFDIASRSVKTGADLVATREIKSDVASSSADTVVFDAFVSVQDKAAAEPFSKTNDRVAFDRKTAQAVNCCGEAVDGDEDVRHSGLSYTFPIGTERKTYQFFDTAARKAFPMEYQGTEAIKGHTVYKFEQTIPEQVIAKQTLPGSWIGQPGKLLVTADMVYSNVRTVWVEPTTGAILKGQEDQLRVLRAPGGPDTTALDATLAFTDKTVDEAVQRAEDGLSKANLISVIGPAVALVLGLALILVGVLVLRRERAAQAAETREPQHAGV